jgi:hypothetical protein
MGLKDRYSVQSIDFALCKEWLLKKHYARRLTIVKFCFGLFDADHLLRGVCCFGYPARCWNNGGSLFDGKHVVDTWELNRLCIDEPHERNVGSFFISRCLKLLPQPFVVVSYADTGYHHCGYIYQASNFLYTGCTRMKFGYKINGLTYHHRTFEPAKYKSVIGSSYDSSMTLNENVKRIGGEAVEQLPKHRYVYIGSKNKKALIRDMVHKVQPYPKEESKRYDCSYKVSVQGQLFVICCLLFVIYSFLVSGFSLVARFSLLP